MKKIASKVTVIITMMFLTSCGFVDNNVGENIDETIVENIESNVTEVSNQIKEKRKYINMAIRPTQSFNPLVNVDQHNKYVFSLIYEDLFFLDDNLKYDSNIISDLNFSEDKLKVTMTIDSNAKWNDGTSILAEDIVYSINQVKYNQNPLYLNNVDFVSSVRADSNNVITVTCVKPMNESTFNLCIPVVQASFYKVADNKLKTNGSGKYDLTEVIDSRNYKLTASNKYKEVASIEEINLKVLESFEFEIDAYNANLIDVIVMNPEDLTEVKNGESTNIINIPTNEYEFIAFNFQNPFVNDINIRRALAYAIPSDDTIQSMYLNASVRTHTSVNPKSYLYYDSFVEYTEDFEKSKQYLTNAGFTELDYEGFAQKNTETSAVTLEFNIVVNEENAYRVNLAKKYSENLKAVGIKSQIIEVPFDEYVQRLNDGRYDMAFVGYLTDSSQNNISLFSEGNVLRYTNARVEDISSRLDNTNTIEEYSAGIDNLQSLVNSDLPVISICYKDTLLLSNNDISNVSVTIGNYYKNIESWLVFE